jgi:hypothetical protein
MSPDEWEQLCDNCGRCCLHKLEDEDTGQIVQTNVACRLLNLETCRCSRYGERKRLVPDCVVLSLENVRELPWMPSTCAYRLVAEGQDLRWWHPLVSGDPKTVHQAGIAVTEIAISERQAQDLEEHVIDWLEE